jgi:hypothetical protein
MDAAQNPQTVSQASAEDGELQLLFSVFSCKLQERRRVELQSAAEPSPISHPDAQAALAFFMQVVVA